MKYSITLDLDSAEIFHLVLTDKQSNESQIFEGKSYGYVLAKAYSYMLKKLRETAY